MWLVYTGAMEDTGSRGSGPKFSSYVALSSVQVSQSQIKSTFANTLCIEELGVEAGRAREVLWVGK